MRQTLLVAIFKQSCPKEPVNLNSTKKSPGSKDSWLNIYYRTTNANRPGGCLVCYIPLLFVPLFLDMSDERSLPLFLEADNDFLRLCKGNGYEREFIHHLNIAQFFGLD